MHSSIYDDALAQLHLNYQGLQDNIITMAREQTRTTAMISRLQGDLETFKAQLTFERHLSVQVFLLTHAPHVG